MLKPSFCREWHPLGSLLFFRPWPRRVLSAPAARCRRWNTPEALPTSRHFFGSQICLVNCFWNHGRRYHEIPRFLDLKSSKILKPSQNQTKTVCADFSHQATQQTDGHLWMVAWPQLIVLPMLMLFEVHLNFQLMLINNMFSALVPLPNYDIYDDIL